MADDPTQEFPLRFIDKSYGGFTETKSINVSDLSNSRFSLSNRIETGTGLGREFVEATRSLLRERLLFAASILAGLILLVLLLSHLFAEPTFQQTILRVISFCLVSMFVLLLVKKPKASLGQLRFIEFFLFAVPMTEACMALWLQSNSLLARKDLGEIDDLHFLTGTAVAVFIAVYGVFIPATWKRTATMTGLAAIVPTLVAFLQTLLQPELVGTGIPNYAMLSLLLMMATVSTLGAAFVNATRKEAVSAKRFGQYRLTREIGRGGMGVVYRAEHALLKRPAAIKLIRAESAFDEKAIERFRNEVQLSATLSHWNTVQIYDYGRTGNGDFYYVMEYLDGESLRDRIRNSGPLSVPETVSLITQICHGLDEAHDRGMVHSDLKPANIFLAKIGGHSDVVKILDFGLAIETKSISIGTDICGSPPYMSPEQILGEAIGPRSDIYSLGCVIFECLTGKQLFSGDSVTEILNAHTRGSKEIPELPNGTEEFAQLIQKCTARETDQRFETLGHVALAVSKLKVAD
ncbi:MAG: serine/threonine-protein kinase [Planctomycetota bacterium]